MKTPHFIAIIEPAKEGFGVYFPDLPGCTSAGVTRDEAARNAIEALALHLASLVKGDEDIPNPTPLDAINVPRGSAPLVVPATLPGKTERINITMDEGTLAAADRIAKERGLSRSGYFAELVRGDMRVAAKSQVIFRAKTPRGGMASYALVAGIPRGPLLGPRRHRKPR